MPADPALRDELLEAANELAEHRPRVALRLLELAREEDLVEGSRDRRERSRILRLMRRACFASLDDTPAAKAIAAAWASRDETIVAPDPGSVDDYLLRLERAGFLQPRKYRQILEDLRG